MSSDPTSHLPVHLSDALPHSSLPVVCVFPLSSPPFHTHFLLKWRPQNNQEKTIMFWKSFPRDDWPKEATDYKIPTYHLLSFGSGTLLPSQRSLYWRLPLALLRGKAYREVIGRCSTYLQNGALISLCLLVISSFEVTKLLHTLSLHGILYYHSSPQQHPVIHGPTLWSKINLPLWG